MDTIQIGMKPSGLDAFDEMTANVQLMYNYGANRLVTGFPLSQSLGFPGFLR